jgi:hypothetical protein
LILLKVFDGELIALKVSSFLKINSRKGLSKPRDITEKSAERMLKLKYAATNFGYRAIYLKIVLKLFI